MSRAIPGRFGLIVNTFALVLALLPLPGFVAATLVDADHEFRESPHETREFRTIARHLHAPFEAYGTLDVLAPQFGVVALSHMASGLMNTYVAEPSMRDTLLPLAKEAVRRARSAAISPTHREVRANTAIDSHNLYWSHLAMALGVERMIRCGAQPCDETDDDALHRRVVETLRARLDSSELAQIPSYPGSPTWPADNTVTLVALRLWDASHGTRLADGPTAAFVRVMNGHRDAATGLYRSAMDRTSYRNIPRGCALSWSTLYLAQVAPEAGRDQYLHARIHMTEDVLGFGGFREWPHGRGGRMDGDSGPIVFGVGMAATGLGLGAARIFRDNDRYAVIRRTALVFGVPSWIPSHGYLLAPILGEAMLFNGRTARPWFAPVAPLVTHADPPWTPIVFSLLDGFVIAWLALRLARAARAVRAPTRPAPGSPRGSVTGHISE
jgi:hypothetical protein